MSRWSNVPWTQIAVEAVAIVGSILLAFAIDAWWEEVQADIDATLLKLQGTTIQKSLQELRMDVAGYYSQALQGDLDGAQFGHDFADVAQKQYFRGRASSIYGGSDEVQKNVTAKHVLGL